MELSTMQAENDSLIEEEAYIKAIPKQERLKNALKAYSDAIERWEASQKLSQHKQIDKPENRPTATDFAYKYGVDRTTLQRRYLGVSRAKTEAHKHSQRLTEVEEESLVNWALRLESWGFPPYIHRMRLQAEELLQARGDHQPLGIHWIQKFLSRHEALKSYFAAPRDQERVNAMTYSIVNDWFKLFEDTNAKYEILPNDTYNMDEKGFAMGQIGKQKVIASSHTMETVMCQSSNREWVSLLECISADGVLLPAFMIFKAKVQKKAWIDELEEGNTIAISDKGWTNNTLAIEWFRRVFNPFTKKRQRGEYRLLILDGHASHITNEAIRFCINEKIILLCLPPHTTHKLQPLDVGFFQPLACRYRSKLIRYLKWDKCVNIEKIDFIHLYQAARKEAAKPSVIISAWEKAYLFPFQPHMLLKTLARQGENINVRPYTPPEISFRASDGTTHTRIIKTPGNVAEFDALIHQAEDNTEKPVQLQKLCKAFERMWVYKINMEVTNNELLQVQHQKADKAKRSKEHLGKGLIMNQEILDERENKAKQYLQEKEDRITTKKVEAERRKAVKQALKQAKEDENAREKAYRETLDCIASLFKEKRARSSKKQVISKTPLIQQSITIDFPPLAPLSPSPSKDPVRRGVRKAADKQHKMKQSKKQGALAIPIAQPITGEQNDEPTALPVQFSTFGRPIRKPKGRA